MFAYAKVKEAIENAKAITIISHINPDADTLGTALGIYTILKEHTKKNIEVINVSNTLPPYLDFLPHFKKIKQKIEYSDSLIITCDGGNIDRFGVDISQRQIINIDHHQSNTYFGTVNIVEPNYASASQVAFKLFHEIYTVNRAAATCFYVALISDTQYLTTSYVTSEVFDVVKSLIDLGAKPVEVAYHLKQRKSLSSIRLLAKALDALTLSHDAKVASIMITQEDIIASGATMHDMEGIVDYAKSLATVEIAICMMEIDNTLRVSVRSKGIDIIPLALAFGGGGHKVAAGFTLKQYTLQESKGIILHKIEKLGLI